MRRVLRNTGLACLVMVEITMVPADVSIYFTGRCAAVQRPVDLLIAPAGRLVCSRCSERILYMTRPIAPTPGSSEQRDSPAFYRLRCPGYARRAVRVDLPARLSVSIDWKSAKSRKLHLWASAFRDPMFADFDRSLREMGTGDLGVGLRSFRAWRGVLRPCCRLRERACRRHDRAVLQAAPSRATSTGTAPPTQAAAGGDGALCTARGGWARSAGRRGAAGGRVRFGDPPGHGWKGVAGALSGAVD